MVGAGAVRGKKVLDSRAHCISGDDATMRVVLMRSWMVPLC